MSEGEKPRVEPEIIPPGRDSRYRGMDRPEQWGTHEGFEEIHHVYVTRLGPFAGLWVTLGIAALSILVLFLMFGAFMILIPLFGALVLAGLIVRWWRGDFWHRPRP